MAPPVALLGSSRISSQLRRRKALDPSRGLTARRGLGVLRVQTPKDIAVELKKLKGDEFKLSKDSSIELVQDVFEIIQTMLENGEEVQFRGFGKFSVNASGTRQFRNPRTGEIFEKDNIVSVSFKASKKLKEALQEAQASKKE